MHLCLIIPLSGSGGLPDNSLPGFPGFPNQGLPWQPGHPDQGLPGHGHPSTGFPPGINRPTHPIVTVPPDFPPIASHPISPTPTPKPPDETAGWVMIYIPGKGFQWVKASDVCGSLGDYVPQPK